jgi:hypothetical protein
MSSIYQSALNAHCEEMKYCQEFIPFSLWLEHKKKTGKYWGA